MTIHCASYGQGIPLVLFHGWGFDSQIWQPLIPLLQSEYRLTLVDLPGFGFTPMMGWNDFKQHVLARLPASFAVAGWSLGGLFATRLAIEAPEKISHLLNITSSPRFLEDTDWPGMQHEVFRRFYQNLVDDATSALRNFVALQLKRSTVQFFLGNQPSASGLESGLNSLATWDLRDQLKTLHLPVGYMFGRLDPITPVKTMLAMQTSFPNFNYILFDKAAHMPFLSHTDLFIQELTGFIK